MIALGIQGLVTGQLTAVWSPLPKGVPAREALAYLCALLSLAAGVGLIWGRTAAVASRTLLAYLLLWSLLFRVPGVVRAPASFQPWDGSAETAVMVAGAWVLYAWFATGVATGESGVRVARVLYGLAMLPFGLAHILYAKETAAMVPAWLPAHLAWAWFTGGAFLAAGVAVLVGACARLGATLSALQIGLFTVLVWVPIIAAGAAGPYQKSEFALSVALTAGAWVAADSYRGTRWFAVGRR